MVPCEAVTFSAGDKAWVTPVLKSLNNRRWKSFRENWPAYNHYRSKVPIAIKKGKRLWGEEKSKTFRDLWSMEKSLHGNEKMTHGNGS